MATLRLDVEPCPLGGLEVEVRIDGRDLASRYGGVGLDPDHVLSPARTLVAVDEPRVAALVRCGCGELGCGGVHVRIRRDGDEVVWDQWDVRLPGRPLRVVRFEAPQYDAELARAERERDWESRERAIARLAAEAVLADPPAQFEAAGLGFCRTYASGEEIVAELEVPDPSGRYPYAYLVAVVHHVGGGTAADEAATLVATLRRPLREWEARWYGALVERRGIPPAVAGPAWRPA